MMSLINFSIYALTLSVGFSLIPLAVPLLGWDWIAVNTCALLLVLGAIAVSKTFWERYENLIFLAWLGFLLALAGAYASNVVTHLLSR